MNKILLKQLEKRTFSFLFFDIGIMYKKGIIYSIIKALKGDSYDFIN